MRPNRTSVWKIMTNWISRALPLLNFQHLNILSAWIGHPYEKLCPFEFLESFRCSISSVSICDVLESDLRVITYDHLNFSRASVVQFRASRHIMCPNLTFVWKVMTIWISHWAPIQAYNILRRSKLNIGSSREIQMVITFHTDVRFGRIICREARNWTTESLKKFKWW